MLENCILGRGQTSRDVPLDEAQHGNTENKSILAIYEAPTAMLATMQMNQNGEWTMHILAIVWHHNARWHAFVFDPDGYRTEAVVDAAD